MASSTLVLEIRMGPQLNALCELFSASQAAAELIPEWHHEEKSRLEAAIQRAFDVCMAQIHQQKQKENPMPSIPREKLDAVRNVLRDSLERLEGVATNRIDQYLDTIESDMIQIAALEPDQVAGAMDDLEVNARGELALLGIDGETEVARMWVFGLRTGAGVLRAMLA